MEGRRSRSGGIHSRHRRAAMAGRQDSGRVHQRGARVRRPQAARQAEGEVGLKKTRHSCELRYFRIPTGADDCALWSFHPFINVDLIVSDSSNPLEKILAI